MSRQDGHEVVMCCVTVISNEPITVNTDMLITTVLRVCLLSTSNKRMFSPRVLVLSMPLLSSFLPVLLTPFLGFPFGHTVFVATFNRNSKTARTHYC